MARSFHLWTWVTLFLFSPNFGAAAVIESVEGLTISAEVPSIKDMAQKVVNYVRANPSESKKELSERQWVITEVHVLCRIMPLLTPEFYSVRTVQGRQMLAGCNRYRVYDRYISSQFESGSRQVNSKEDAEIALSIFLKELPGDYFKVRSQISIAKVYGLIAAANQLSGSLANSRSSTNEDANAILFGTNQPSSRVKCQFSRAQEQLLSEVKKEIKKTYDSTNSDLGIAVQKGNASRRDHQSIMGALETNLINILASLPDCALSEGEVIRETKETKGVSRETEAQPSSSGLKSLSGRAAAKLDEILNGK